MVRGLSSTASITLDTRSPSSLLGPHILPTQPPCSDLVSEPTVSSPELFGFLLLTAVGIVGNCIVLLLQCGRSKLSTASFTYLRILTILHLAFFVLPFPLRFLTENLQRGHSWTSANFLPVLLGVWHFSIISLIMCFAIRLQLIINFVRVRVRIVIERSRRWTSTGWIAWRKLFCILPLATIINVSLCFEYQLRYDYCTGSGGQKLLVGRSRLAAMEPMHRTALHAIRLVPTFLYWLTVLMTASFVLSEKFVLPKLSSPFASRHKRLFSNLRPLVIGLVFSQSIVHIPSTYAFVRSTEMNEKNKLMLYTLSYALPAPIMLLLSQRLRAHLWLLLCRVVERKKEAARRKASEVEGKTISALAMGVAYSKLELENSEMDERSMSGQVVRALLRDDAVYRVRFAMHSTSVPTVIEETEEEESVDDMTQRRRPPDEELPWSVQSYIVPTQTNLILQPTIHEVVDV